MDIPEDYRDSNLRCQTNEVNCDYCNECTDDSCDREMGCVNTHINRDNYMRSDLDLLRMIIQRSSY